jgi:hypothetical protein
MATGFFEEKEYEGAATVELTSPSFWSWRGRPGYWPVGQVLEAVLGIDAGFEPAKREIWKLLRHPRPRGVVVTPDFWLGSPAGLPLVPDLSCERVSLLLNFKRPESYVRKGRKLFGAPYYRFSVRNRPPSPNQHAILTTLATNLSDDVAVVRYAAAAFQLRTDLEAFKATRDVLRQSCFVSPMAIVAPHTAWAYQGPGLLGAPNPTGEPEPGEDLDGLQEILLKDRRPQSLRAHLRKLAATSAETLPTRLVDQIDNWVRGSVAELGVSDTPEDARVYEALRNLTIVSSAAARAGAHWLHIVRLSGAYVLLR